MDHKLLIRFMLVTTIILSIQSAALTSAHAGGANSDAETTTDQPVLPKGCEALEVPAGNNVYFSTYAIGVQIYRWNGTSWSFVAPSANLFASRKYHGQVGTHYAGPTWESNSGSKVAAARVAGCSPNDSAIAWLLLNATANEGPGIFEKTTFIQRVNTVGGLPPSSPGTVVGERTEIPYTTEYYFYKAED